MHLISSYFVIKLLMNVYHGAAIFTSSVAKYRSNIYPLKLMVHVTVVHAHCRLDRLEVFLDAAFCYTLHLARLSVLRF
jgi:hypothetical protein